MDQLTNASRRLLDGGARLDTLIAELDAGLGQLDVALDYMHPRPLAEAVRRDAAGKRVIELSYLCYREIDGRRCLAVRTIKVLESKAALASTVPTSIVPLRSADIALRQAAIDIMGELLSGITAQMERMADGLEDRCEAASSIVRAIANRRSDTRSSSRRRALHPSYPQLRRRTEPPIRVTRAGY